MSITLLENPNTNRLCEVFQSNEIKFAFVNYTNVENTMQLLMSWVKCREYFNELLMKNHHPDEFNFDQVHGFQYNYDDFPLNTEELLLAIKFPSKNSKEQFIANLPFIHDVEKLHNLPPTTYQLTTTTNTLVIKGSKFWQQHCLLLNIYSMLIKLLALNYPQTKLEHLETYNKISDIKELHYLYKVSVPTFDSLLQQLPVVLELPQKYVDGRDELVEPYTIHGYSGIIAALKQNTNAFTKALKKLLQNPKPYFLEATS